MTVASLAPVVTPTVILDQASAVNADPAAGDYGLPTRVVPSGQLFDALLSVSGSIGPDVARERTLTVGLAREQSTLWGQIRTVEPFAFLDATFANGISDRTWGTRTANSGTVNYDSAARAAVVAASTPSGSSATLRTHTYLAYQAGRAMRIVINCLHSDTGITGQTRRWGFFDDDNGLFFELNDNRLRVGRRSSVSGFADNTVEQSEWNVDPMDGTGPSGVTIDVSKLNSYEIQAQSFCTGAVQFVINGRVVHIFNLPNTSSVPYMQMGEAPVQVEVTNTALTTAGSISVLCAAVYVEGGAEPSLSARGIARATTLLSVGTSYKPVLAVRVASLFNGRTNRKIVLPRLLVMSNAGGRARIEVVLNPTTLTDASWQAITDSGVEYDVSATAFTGGRVVYSDYLPNTNDRVVIDGSEIFTTFGTHMRQSAFANSTDTLLFVAKSITGTVDMDAAMVFMETR